ncbi:MAG: sigma-54 dependent transcriptional regulator [Chromatiaceae bacterium]|jgi:DNA-binding NtrC family response regulator|nr:sigma-54 dependent transcriptional regulator [Chromatiaceae bacterium]
MRKLLVVTSQPLSPPVDETLRDRDWELVETGDVRAAEHLIAREDFRVGLAVLWPSDPDPRAAAIAELVERSSRIRWVGAIDRSQMVEERCMALAAQSLYDYLSLPLDAERVAVILGHAYGMAEVESQFLARQRLGESGRFGMVGASPPMRALFREIERAAATSAPVVLIGETGTGKEMAARAIHANSGYCEGPFVAVNCAAIPASLIQAELYGYEAGAFTDASEGRAGYIESAEGGTLFLDEVAELSPEAQVSLLRFLESGQIVRLGSSTPRRVDVRILSATHSDLEELVHQQDFRLDLYYRLHVLRIELPSLRERGEDILMLAQHFLSELLRTSPTRVLGFSRSALVAIGQYDWPGNLRELRNRVHQAAVYSAGRYISPTDLGLTSPSRTQDSLTLQAARELAEAEAIRDALRRTGRNMTRAAEDLQISRMTLYRLLQKHGLDYPR